MALASDAAARAAPGPDGTLEAASGGQPQAPEELIEAQLRAILEATGTSAGAVCLFDQHQELLRLAVEVGLSDEGCRRLRSVRRGAATTWDMPLHSLLNRRVYLIESAAKNRYVPPLVEDVAAVRAVACVPLYDGSTPVGSLILVALAPRGFGERQVRSLEQPARQLVTHIVSMRKRVTGAGPVRVHRPGLAANAPAALGSLQTAAPTVAGPTTPRLAPLPAPAAGAGDEAGAPNASPIQGAVDRARVELERLRTRVAEAEEHAAAERARASTEVARRTELEAELAAARTERDGVARALADQAGEIQASAERLRALDAALDEARATEASLRAEIQSVHEASAGRAAATHADQTAAVETGLARIAELEALNATLEQRIDDVETISKAAITAASTRADAVAADAEARIASAARDAAERVHAATVEVDELRARLVDAEGATTRTGADADAVVRELAGARSRIVELEARLTAAAADGDARLAAVRIELEERHATTLAEWQRRCEAAEAARESSPDQASSGDTGASLLDDERREWDAELAAVRQREAELEQRLAALQADLDRARTEDDQLRDGFAHLESLLQTSVDAESVPTAASTESDGSAFEVVELDGSGEGDDGSLGMLEVDTLDVEEVGEPETRPAETGPGPSAAAAPPEGVLVLDAEAFWTSVAPKGTAISLVTPGPDIVAAMAAQNPERILLNLGAPGTLGALAALREAGVIAPAFACIVAAGQTRGIVVGRLELAARPIDPDALLVALQGVFARGTKVVTAGADVDGLISLRQALARLGVSVSMAWDAKQAGDLLTMVHPEVAIIDLELPPKDGCALVARMGLASPPPFTVVIPKATDTAPSFAAALAHPELGRSTLPAKELLARLLALPERPTAPTGSGRR